jgi:hypothetical protein
MIASSKKARDSGYLVAPNLSAQQVIRLSRKYQFFMGRMSSPSCIASHPVHACSNDTPFPKNLLHRHFGVRELHMFTDHDDPEVKYALMCAIRISSFRTLVQTYSGAGINAADHGQD